MKYSKFIVQLVSVFIIITFIVAGCGNKSDTSDTVKKDNTNQTNTNQTNTNNNTNTQKMDSTKIQKDSITEKINAEPDTVIMETSLGNMTIELYPKDAPLHVANFKKLVYNKYYDGLLFHRVIPNFMIQGGDPNTRTDKKDTYGQGGPGYTIPAEIKLKHEKGSLAAARMGDAQNPKRESSGSQFYIVTGEASHLDGQYSVYGKVIKGLEVADKIQNVKRDASDDPIDKVVIKKVYFVK